MSTSVYVIRKLFIALLIAGISPATRALTLRDVDVVCPIGGKTFRTVQAMSGTQIGIFLDFKPFGPIAAPRPIAKCPGNGFVVFKESFSHQEIVRLTPYVMTAKYQALQRNESNYYLAAQLERVLRDPVEHIAFTLLRATWEARSQDQYAKYAVEALEAFETALKRSHPSSKQWVTDQLAALELQRRLGRFDEATSRLAVLSRVPDGEMTSVSRSMIELQTELVARRDARSTLLPDTNHQKADNGG